MSGCTLVYVVNVVFWLCLYMYMYVNTAWSCVIEMQKVVWRSWYDGYDLGSMI